MKPYILAAAIWYKDNYIKHENQPLNIQYGIVIAGRRHDSCYSILKMINNSFGPDDTINGFITSNNLFLKRCEAAKTAWDANQLLSHITKCPDYLISEHLYWGNDI